MEDAQYQSSCILSVMEQTRPPHDLHTTSNSCDKSKQYPKNDVYIYVADIPESKRLIDIACRTLDTDVHRRTQTYTDVQVPADPVSTPLSKVLCFTRGQEA
jgi:hypothetical protein